MAPTRLDSIADLESFFDLFGQGQTNNGVWLEGASGTTGSSDTGPGTNSSGPYVYSESSGSNPNANSLLDVNAATMSAWTGSGRILSLRASIAGEFSVTGGISVQGRISNSDAFNQIELLEGWAYEANRVCSGRNAYG